MTIDVDDLERRTRVLLASDRVTAATRAALLERLDRPNRPLLVLQPAQAQTLAAAAARLVPTPELALRIDAVGRLDEALARGVGDGWRYADLPVDIEAYRAAVEGLDACAQAAGGCRFAELAPEIQDAVLRRVQAGEPLARWRCAPALWFREFLGALSDIVFSHPLMQMRMGYDGMADARGWSAESVVRSDA